MRLSRQFMCCFLLLPAPNLIFLPLTVAGWLGFVYFVFRFFSKVAGTYLGGTLAGAPHILRKYLGLALVPQAGIAIGLVFLINGDLNLNEYAAILTQTVLVGVLLAELIGPACTKYALERSGEAVVDNGRESGAEYRQNRDFSLEETREAQLVPWSWEKTETCTDSCWVCNFRCVASKHRWRAGQNGNIAGPLFQGPARGNQY